MPITISKIVKFTDEDGYIIVFSPVDDEDNTDKFRITGTGWPTADEAIDFFNSCIEAIAGSK